MVKLKYSKSKIDKAGEVLLGVGLKITEAGIALNIHILSNWRAFHAMSLDTFAKTLKNRVKK